MGICLDTEQSDSAQTFGEETWTQNSPNNHRRNNHNNKNNNKNGRDAAAATPSAGKFPMHNDTSLQFESPKVPVIFVLGGPGSGKVTHCDNLMQEKKEIVHINMSDLLQQYAIGNDVPDYGQLSSRTVTEVLMLEMKMAPNAKTYLVSGYPRNMRDVVEYSEKIEVVNGVILISWRQKVLERQIDYGAKLGQVVLSLAKMELSNFYKNVIPVAEYFDESHMLVSIHGERPPADVYKDFRSAVFHILGSQENPPEFTSRITEPLPTTTTSELPIASSNSLLPVPTQLPDTPPPPLPAPPLSSPQPPRPTTHTLSSVGPPGTGQSSSTFPPVLWVIGGPGSNKAALCSAAAHETGWTHISLGKLLRAATEDTDTHKRNEINKLKECIGNGELVPLEIVRKFIENQMVRNVEAKGIILDGFPRDLEQAQGFEEKFQQKPTIILLDCSKLQLGKGRLDDSVTAFRRRLESFRQSSLPMLKTMDNIGRLTIVDGDTDTAPVQEDFKNVVKEHIEYMLANRQHTEPSTAQLDNNHMPNGHVSTGTANNGHAIQNGHIPNGGLTLPNVENNTATSDTTISNNNNKTYANGKAHLMNGITKLSNQISNSYGHRNNEVNYMDGHI